MKKGRVKKVKPTPITAKEMYDKMLDENVAVTDTELMIAFAKQKVTEALHETSEHFKNADNISYIKNHYSLDKIV